ncbi:MAG: hypothetical protein WCT85_05945 [Parachlamydiales bacterium]|jgi:hypothetical protein
MSGFYTSISSFAEDLSNSFNENVMPYFSDISIEKVKSFSVEVLKTTKECIGDISRHYPKTILICFVANVIFSILKGSITGFIGVAVDCYLLYPHRNHIFCAIKVYNKHNISEWTSSFEEKENLKDEIIFRVFKEQTAAKISSFSQRISNFFHL